MKKLLNVLGLEKKLWGEWDMIAHFKYMARYHIEQGEDLLSVISELIQKNADSKWTLVRTS